jgi:hypothetical protein
VAAVLEGMLFGAAILGCSALAVHLAYGPARTYGQLYTNHDLAYVAGALSLVGVLLTIIALLSAADAARVAVVIGAVAGCGFAMLGWHIVRASTETEQPSERRRQLG